MTRTYYIAKGTIVGRSLVAQWLGLFTFTAKGAGSILGQRIKILQDTQYGQERKKRELYSTFCHKL